MEERVADSLGSPLAARTVQHPAGAYRIVAITDPHVEGSAWEEGERLASWIAAESSSSNPVRALLLAGDLTDAGTEAQYAAVKSVLDAVAASGVAVLPVIGNHDLYTSDGWAFWKRYLTDGADWYPSTGRASFVDPSSVETLRIVLLDSAECAIGSTQLSYLQDSLSSTVPNIVLTHVPLVSSYDNSIWYLESDYERLFILNAMRSVNAPLYLTGHAHIPSSIAVGSVTQVLVEAYYENRAALVITVDPTAGVVWESASVP